MPSIALSLLSVFLAAAFEAATSGNTDEEVVVVADTPDLHWGSVYIKAPDDEPSFAEMEYVVYRKRWHDRSDGQPRILLADTCDYLVTQSGEWKTLDALTRASITDCVYNRVRIDVVRSANPKLHWLPQDLLTNPDRKFVFVFDLVKSGLVAWQYARDSKAPLDEILARVRGWRAMGLNVSHYAHLTTQEELDALRAAHTLDDYMRWNEAGQREAVQWLEEIWSEWVLQIFPRDDASTMMHVWGLVLKALLQ